MMFSLQNLTFLLKFVLIVLILPWISYLMSATDCYKAHSVIFFFTVKCSPLFSFFLTHSLSHCLPLAAHPCFHSIHYSFCLLFCQPIPLHLSISLFVLPVCTTYTRVGSLTFHLCCSSLADCRVCHTNIH